MTGTPLALAYPRSRRAKRAARRMGCVLPSCSSSRCQRRHRVRNPLGVYPKREVGVQHIPVHTVVGASETVVIAERASSTADGQTRVNGGTATPRGPRMPERAKRVSGAE